MTEQRAAPSRGARGRVGWRLGAAARWRRRRRRRRRQPARNCPLCAAARDADPDRFGETNEGGNLDWRQVGGRRRGVPAWHEGCLPAYAALAHWRRWRLHRKSPGPMQPESAPFKPSQPQHAGVRSRTLGERPAVAPRSAVVGWPTPSECPPSREKAWTWASARVLGAARTRADSWRLPIDQQKLRPIAVSV